MSAPDAMRSWDGRIRADARRLPITSESVQCIVTSPPYWGLRDYGNSDQIGLERTPEEYVESLRSVALELWRVLKTDGTLWLNLGDCFATGGGSVGRAPGGGDQGERFIRAGMIGTQPNRMPIPGLKSKDLIGIPWRVAFALQADGWYLRQDIIWHKPNPMPESVTDRPTTSHEYIFLLTKNERYFYDSEAIKETAAYPNGPTGSTRKARGGGNKAAGAGHTNLAKCGLVAYETRNKRSVWTVALRPYSEAHYATFPPDLVEPCILAGSRPGDIVLDPFFGSGTVGRVAEQYSRRWIGVDLGYQDLQAKRVRNVQRNLLLHPDLEASR